MWVLLGGCYVGVIVMDSSSRANCQFDLLCSEEIVILVSKRTLAIGLGKCSAALPVTAAQFLLNNYDSF